MPPNSPPIRRHGLLFHIADVALNIIIIVAIVGAIRTFLVSPFQVEGNSMFETLEDKEYIIINKLAYYLDTPGRGDVVVFRPPVDHKKHYVKRVIGVPGDEVILRDGYVYVKPAGSDVETKIAEPYLSERNNGKTYRHPPTSGNTEETRYQVPGGRYFLMGDNRQGSLDSRSFMAADGEPIPYVDAGDIKGRVWFVALPITKIHALEPPDYRLHK